jgi:hypothetical protein
VRQLIDYIITEPLDDDYNAGHKFPFLAIETLCCETVKVQDILLRNENRLCPVSEKEDLKVKETNKYLNNTNPQDFEEEEIEEMITVEENNKSDLSNSQENKIKIQSVEYSNVTYTNDKEEECEAFFKSELLEHLLSFLETKSHLNHVLAGYFSRFFNYLFMKNSSLVSKIMIKQDPEVFIHSTS